MRKLDNESEEITTGEELRIIQQMIEKTKVDTAYSGYDLLFWGWTALAACICHYILVFLGAYHLVWLPWAILMPLAFIIHIIKIVKDGKHVKVVTYTQRAIMSLWISCGISIFMIAFLAIPLNALPIKSISPVIAIIIAIAMFTTGYIFDWKPSKISGALWWICAVVMMLVHFHYHIMVFSAGIILGYLVPGYMLRRQYLRKKT